MKRHPAYIVKWRDSATLRGWRAIDDQSHDVSIITSIGWLVRETPRTITLTASISDGGNVADAISIPREAIAKMTRLKYHIANES